MVVASITYNNDNNHLGGDENNLDDVSFPNK